MVDHCSRVYDSSRESRLFDDDDWGWEVEMLAYGLYVRHRDSNYDWFYMRMPIKWQWGWGIEIVDCFSAQTCIGLYTILHYSNSLQIQNNLNKVDNDDFCAILYNCPRPQRFDVLGLGLEDLSSFNITAVECWSVNKSTKRFFVILKLSIKLFPPNTTYYNVSPFTSLTLHTRVRLAIVTK